MTKISEKEEILKLIKTNEFKPALNKINRINKKEKTKYFYQKLYCFYRLQNYKKVEQQIRRKKPEGINFKILEIQTKYNLQKYEEAFVLFNKINGKISSSEWLINCMAIQSLLLNNKPINWNPFCFINKKYCLLEKRILVNQLITKELTEELEFNSCFQDFDFNSFPNNSLCNKQLKQLIDNELINKYKLFQRHQIKLSDDLIYKGTHYNYKKTIKLLNNLLNSSIISWDSLSFKTNQIEFINIINGFKDLFLTVKVFDTLSIEKIISKILADPLFVF